MSTLFVNNLNTASGSTITIPTGKTLVGTDEGTIRTPGTILQVKQTYYQGTSTFSGSNSFVSNINLDCVITPKATSSKILIQVMLSYSTSTAGCGNGIGLDRVIGGSTTSDIVRSTGASTADLWIGLNNNYDQSNSGGILMNAFGSYLDSPNTTSAITYKPKFWFVAGSTPIKMNRSNSGQHGGPSITTLFEIAG